MATFGALNNANNDTNFDANGLVIVGGGAAFAAGGGTITDVNFYGARLAGGGTQYRFGLYQGGASATDPNGASRIYESGIIDCSGYSTSAAWRTVSGLSVAATGGSRLWLVLKSDVAIRMFTALSADLGDLPLGFGYYTGTQSGMNVSTIGDALPASISASYTSGGGSSNVKFYVTYTPAGGTSLAAIANYYRRMRSGK